MRGGQGARASSSSLSLSLSCLLTRPDTQRLKRLSRILSSSAGGGANWLGEIGEVVLVRRARHRPGGTSGSWAVGENGREVGGGRGARCECGFAEDGRVTRQRIEHSCGLGKLSSAGRCASHSSDRKAFNLQLAVHSVVARTLGAGVGRGGKQGRGFAVAGVQAGGGGVRGPRGVEGSIEWSGCGTFETGGLLLSMGGGRWCSAIRTAEIKESGGLWPTTSPAALSLSVSLSYALLSWSSPRPSSSWATSTRTVPLPPSPSCSPSVGVVVVGAISGPWFRHLQMSPLSRGAAAGTEKSNRGGQALGGQWARGMSRPVTGSGQALRTRRKDEKRRGGVKIRWTQNPGSSRQDQCRYRGCGGVRDALAGNQEEGIGLRGWRSCARLPGWPISSVSPAASPSCFFLFFWFFLLMGMGDGERRRQGVRGPKHRVEQQPASEARDCKLCLLPAAAASTV